MRGLRSLLLSAFALGLAYFILQVAASPRLPDYVVRSSGATLSSPDPDATRVYLRRVLHLTQTPRSAWIEILGEDDVQLWVNGVSVAHERRGRLDVALLADITTHLTAGPNVLAVRVQPIESDGPPPVAIRGGFTLSDGDHVIDESEGWRANTLFEREASNWFSPEFDDRHWPVAAVSQGRLRAITDHPPRSVEGIGRGHWIYPADTGEGFSIVRREFTQWTRPRQAWMRVLADADYRLAVNGNVIDLYERHLGTGRPLAEPAWRSYDLLPFLRRGPNSVTIAVTGRERSTPIVVEGEIMTRRGIHGLDSDSDWTGRRGPLESWTSGSSSDWSPVRVAVASFDPTVRTASTTYIRGERSAGIGRFVVWFGLSVLIGIVTGWAVDRAARFVRTPGDSPADTFEVCHLALLPSVLGVATAMLVVFDPRIAKGDVYAWWWLVLLVALAPLQWLLLSFMRSRASQRPTRTILAPPDASRALLVLGIVVLVGFGLRASRMFEQPLHPDEVTVYRSTQGVLERGFPSIEVGEHLPVSYAATSELVYYFNALFEIVFNRDQIVVRGPSVIWGTLTIVLMYVFGARLFGRVGGLVAAGLYAISPLAIEMSNFGRYFSQLQFLTLLTIYLLHRTVGRSGPVNRRLLWLTAACFAATFLSWEGIALIAPGIALAVLLQRRRSLAPVIRDPHVWAAMGVIALLVLTQQSHRILQQSQRLWYGVGASGVSAELMASYPGFDPVYYMWRASWLGDAFLPVLGLLSAIVLAMRHGYRRPLRFLFIIFLANCVLMALVLPVRASRYAYHLMPLLLLVVAALLVAISRGLTRRTWKAWETRAPAWWGTYSRALGAAVLVLAMLLSSGWVVQLSELGFARGSATEVVAPDHEGAVEFIRERMQDGDLVLATVPHAVSHYLGRDVDYWPETTLHLQAALNDVSPVPRHRLTGTEMIPDLDSLREVFSDNPRVWFVAVPTLHAKTNDNDVSTYLRSNMEVVHETTACLVMFRGNRYRPADLQLRHEEELNDADAVYLP